MQSLHWLDYAVLGTYVLLVIIICWRSSKASPDADDLFLAGRSLGVGAVGLSLFASNISSTTLIGLPGAAWSNGIAVANYEWMAGLVLVVSAVFIAPVLLGSRITTIPELLERRFDSRLRRYLSAITIFLSIVLDTAGSLYAGALVLKLFFPMFDLWMVSSAIAIFAGIYTAAGGLRAVVYTDVVQAIVLLGGSMLLAGMVFSEFDWSWHQVVERVDPDKLSLIRPLNDEALPWLGTLIGLPILGFYYWTMNQYVSQRLLGARDIRTAGHASLLAATLKLMPLFFMVLPGAMASVLLPDLARADMVFPELVARYAPLGLSGLILAGLLAAIMSSVDSALNSASTLITVDFIQPRRPGLSTQQLARIGRISTLVLVIIAAIWAPMIDRFPGLFDYLQQTFAYVASPLVALFLLGFYSRVGTRSALFGTLGGHAVSVVWFIATQLGWVDWHFTIVAGVLFLLTLVLTLIGSRVLDSQANDEQLAAVDRARVAPAPRSVHIGTGVLVVATAMIVIAFW
jgi:SSS family solute:Na+ symporter